MTHTLCAWRHHQLRPGGLLLELCAKQQCCFFSGATVSGLQVQCHLVAVSGLYHLVTESGLYQVAVSSLSSGGCAPAPEGGTVALSGGCRASPSGGKGSHICWPWGYCLG